MPMSAEDVPMKHKGLPFLQGGAPRSSVRDLLDTTSIHIAVVAVVSLGFLSACTAPAPTYNSQGVVVVSPSRAASQTPMLSAAKQMQDQSLADPEYRAWVRAYPWRTRQVERYLNFLSAQQPRMEVPANQLLLTAQSYASCNRAKFTVAPEELWPNMLPTLRLLTRLKNEGVFGSSVQVVSAYRDPHLNTCAGGAPSSQHLQNSALDLWVPVDSKQERERIQRKLCQFWATHGEPLHFGLGLYTSGSYHIDTGGFRTWGSGVLPKGDCRSMTGASG